MTHLTILEFGAHIGRTSERIVVHFRDKEKEDLHVPLRRLKTLCIAKEGVSISAAVINALAQRGVKIFFHDFRGMPVACVSGTHQHAVVKVRKRQFAAVDSKFASEYSKQFIYGKIRNKRAVLLHFAKYKEIGNVDFIKAATEELRFRAENIKNYDFSIDKNWRFKLLGFEGEAADIYWRCIADDIGVSGFKNRVGRGARDLPNVMLNYAYGILMSYIWAAVVHSGLEPYAGFLHVDRPGKPSLVLDLIEEYRGWVADRAVLKFLRSNKVSNLEFDVKIKKYLVNSVRETMAARYPFKNKRYRLESILQNQIYKLVGAMADNRKKYKPYLFKW